MITRIEIKGLRALRYVDVALTPFQVFVGPNASGKSTFFDAVALVRDILQAGVESAIRGNARLDIPMRAADARDLTWNRKGETIEIAISAQRPALSTEPHASREHIRYELAINVDGELALHGENFWLIDEAAQRNEASPQRTLFPLGWVSRSQVAVTWA